MSGAEPAGRRGCEGRIRRGRTWGAAGGVVGAAAVGGGGERGWLLAGRRAGAGGRTARSPPAGMEKRAGDALGAPREAGARPWVRVGKRSRVWVHPCSAPRPPAAGPC